MINKIIFNYKINFETLNHWLMQEMQTKSILEWLFFKDSYLTCEEWFI